MPTELHLALQEHYAGDCGVIEAAHGRYKIDVLLDGVAYEIQTGNFHKIREKVARLSKTMQVVIVFPVAERKVIVRVDAETGEEISSRKSPKRSSTLEAFTELREIAKLLGHSGVCLEIVRTVQRELRCNDGKGSRWRRRMSVVGRELVEILGTQRFDTPEDYLTLLPSNLPGEFTVADLAQAAGISRWLAGHVAFTLYHAGAARRVGKRGNAHIHEIGASGEREAAGSPWGHVRCSRCGLAAFESQEGSVVRWRCAGCGSLQVWPAE